MSLTHLEEKMKFCPNNFTETRAGKPWSFMPGIPLQRAARAGGRRPSQNGSPKASSQPGQLRRVGSDQESREEEAGVEAEQEL
jgi:hypothetical protein